MNQYVTGAVIKKLRERKKMTQADLAEILSVSDKAISKWETGRGYPDMTLINSLAEALGISTIELLSGNDITNSNRSSNMLRSQLYVCPVCGNIIHSTGKAVMSCCGIVLPTLEGEDPDEEHLIQIEKIEDEHYITINHEMKKEHYISFIAYASGNIFDMVKLYPEGNAEARFRIRGSGKIYCYCNKHGLFSCAIKPKRT
ncbi:helix-turn-helix domain-containing protein [Peptostreptococcus faecalis]|uniref:helix-turn-helix domain-containing protein n=1 Tax=Peptostreptococcus faecalis TaxID=2045015 RepID=UPI000C7C93B8|nr:helix-turn-helix domain-containing protein [Peptostreptococcus faecalis]